MHRRLNLFHTWLMMALALFCGAGSLLAADKMNVVVILVDDLGARDLACYGSQFYETPNIDRLAQDGMRFTDAYSAHPRCVPSRVGFLTGKFPARLGQPGAPVDPNAMPLSEISLGEAFHDQGYATGYIGKWHVGHADAGPAQQGFDVSIAAGEPGATGSHFAPYVKAPKIKANDKPEEATKGKGKHKEGEEPLPNLPLREGDEYLTDRLTDEAVGFIQGHRDEPFMLVLAHYAVHTPIEGKKDYTKIFRRKADATDHDGEPYEEDHMGIQKMWQDNAAYGAMVRSVDDSVGTVRAALQELGLADNTIVLFTSDHGGLSSRGLTNNRELATSNLPLRHGKGWLYEGGIRVPLIVAGPGIGHGATSSAVVTGTDHYPTLLHLTGLEPRPEQTLDGMDYTAALQGKPFERGPIYWHSPLSRPNSTGDTNATAMREGRYKLIEWYDEKLVELYDLSTDPGEHHNLADEDKATTAAMLKKLRDWRAAAPNATVAKAWRTNSKRNSNNDED